MNIYLDHLSKMPILSHAETIPQHFHRQKEAKMSEARKQATAEPVDTEWVSLTEASKLLGTHRETVLKLALRGQLEIDHRGMWTFVSRASIDRYLAANPAAVAQ